MLVRPARLLPLFALLLAGCGAAEYEARLKEAQERVKRHEEESKLLGTPITPPNKKSAEGTSEALVPFMLRLPAGLSATPTPEARGGVFYDYAQPKAGAAGPFAWASVAFAKADDAAFADALMKWFAAAPPVNRTPHVTKPGGRPGVAFTRTTFEDGSGTYWYSINLHQGKQGQVAVVYAVHKGQANQAARAIDLSLDTFGFEASLDAARKAFRPTGPLDAVPR